MQPASAMALSLVQQQDNVCFNGTAGSLTVGATGGTAPYEYNDGGSWQPTGDFTGLASGSYTIGVRDVNGCSVSSGYVVRALNPALTVSATVGSVQCYGGSDGSIGLGVSGGAGGYSYVWRQPGGAALAVNGSTATGLTAGTYAVSISDAQGCGVGDTIAVSQPAALSASVVVRPVCSDATGGTVQVLAGGGTPPYYYSVDGGVHEQGDPGFVGLPAGGYTVWVSDSHGCSWKQAATVGTNPLVPAVDFLVSTQQNALDTLQVEDISVPKPDSVQWTFDPATLKVGTDSMGPMIRYTQAGTYPAQLRAWYGGCDFTVSQNIVIGAYDSSVRSAAVVAGMSFDTVSITPNPNNGVFNIYVKLYKAQRLVLTVTSLAGVPVYQKEWEGQSLVAGQIVLPAGVVAGSYVAQLVTETDVRDFTLIVTSR